MSYPSIIVPGRPRFGYLENYSFKEQYGPGNFAKGQGTFFPMPSMPLAQCFRYFWAVKRWRVQINITMVDEYTYDYGSGGTDPSTTIDTIQEVMDSGWIPYPCGYDANFGGSIITPRTFGGGDPLTIIDDPRNRLAAGYSGRESAPSYTLPGNFFGPDCFGTQEIVGGPTIPYPVLTPLQAGFYIGLMNYAPSAAQIAADPTDYWLNGPAGASGYTTTGLVLDDATPGNAFMSIYIGNTHTRDSDGDPIDSAIGPLYSNGLLIGDAGYPFAPVADEPWSESGVNCSLDGMPIGVLYYQAPPPNPLDPEPNSFSITGTIDILTSDTDS